MKFIDEYRDAEAVKRYARAIRKIVTRPWTLMEICGGQTHAIVRFGLDALLPNEVTLAHGPGCPVCVTPIELIDKAIALAQREKLILCSFGDMLRVPGSSLDLLSAKAQGGDVRVVYSPLDALKIAKENPDSEVVFFAVGFETTAPANAMAVYQAKNYKIDNFSILTSHALVPPAMQTLLSAEGNRVQGFLAAGHVCAIMGEEEYHPIAEKYKVPIVITGFEPLDILEGVYLCVKQLEQGRHVVENQYIRSVPKQGNPHAQKVVREVFEVVTRKWRGIGPISQSGLGLKEEYQAFDADKRYSLQSIEAEESPDCLSGDILRGAIKPHQCPAFGKSCTPEHPLGAPMVSTEGACSAYYIHRRHTAPTPSICNP
ncbi:hydrogenase formation protein HypD [Pelagicoccus mobilis]|uniref:Hydrogenase formation protein HypD n=1 Tax=Pelagicoccus mobilis TaxID=415221 RepID=A0A934VPW4_9BACT|nr:hydrogenase formation protein HypD [Pelagicoccus mobilis]MBK1876245.1 hydrogenase formation protein HypD [Pelagicoccus mobilis]